MKETITRADSFSRKIRKIVSIGKSREDHKKKVETIISYKEKELLCFWKR